ncbi:MAG: YkgJ family cysteine cluster protein [Spirochaetaceae bacterium]|nr:YkgJ family cysteine cluster protein [Spirochaetaceae bacterium]
MNETPLRPFYDEGLRFSCLRCSTCCRYDEGFVFLTAPDIEALSRELQMKTDDFTAVYCRRIRGPDGSLRLSLKEKANYDCIFWKDGCSVYKARPLQCRAFPFWPSLLASPAAWKAAARSCPGMGQGVLHTKEEIERCLRDQRADM